MRPVRLELHGFTTFREKVEIDFAGADLFALTGPTGAGKSSIIDGMCFALYGSVPRLDRRTVAPVISTGKNEARIRFDFTIGEKSYTAVRVVRRTPTGATTKEARLEAGGETLAGDADGVSAAAEKVLGLGFEQFTKSVVLPQGDFARFLHDKPSARQELLVKLLELGVYERMRSEANSRKVAAESAIEITEQQLRHLVDATPEAVEAAGARVDQLVTLRTEVDEVTPQLDELARRRTEQADQADRAGVAAATLEAVAMPEGLSELADALAAAERNAAAAAAAADKTQKAVAKAENARAKLADAAALQRLRDAHGQRTSLAERIAKGTPIVAAAQEAETIGAAAVKRSAAAVTTAEAALEAVRREHAAHAVAATLVAGEDCPVCLQTVTTVPKRDAPAALAEAEAQKALAVREHADAQAALGPLQTARVRAEQQLETLTEELGRVDAALADAPTADEIARALDAITTAEADLATAREHDRAARAAATEAAAAVARGREERQAAWSRFDAARDRVAALGAPAIARDDLGQAWASLVDWATQEAKERRRAAETARKALASAAADLQKLESTLTSRCTECAVVVPASGRVRDAVGDAVAAAESEQRRLRDALEQAQRHRLAITAHRERADVAKELARHLSSRGFEQWLLDEALSRLASGASEILRALSSGQYSLTLDTQRNFLVIDHRSADEQRPARTLSGGETFLASLSLALTLAEHLGQLAVGSEPRLESIFLDEGFGTLDPETLDTVAAAIEELGARGRTVGIVTHVRDLAERMPVRFEVQKGLGGSIVERVER